MLHIRKIRSAVCRLFVHELAWCIQPDYQITKCTQNGVGKKNYQVSIRSVGGNGLSMTERTEDVHRRNPATYDQEPEPTVDTDSLKARKRCIIRSYSAMTLLAS